MKTNFRQRLIAVITFIGGLYFFLEFILPKKIGSFQFGLFHDQISRGVIVVGTMAIGLGVINILRVHGTAILKSRKGWGNSLALLIGLFVMFLVEGNDFVNSEKNLSGWKEIAHLEMFSKRIFEDYTAKKIPGGERVEMLIASLERIVSEAEAGQGFLSTKGEDKEKRFAADLFLNSAQKAQEKATMLKNRYTNLSGSELTAESPLLKNEHQQLENQLKATVEGAKELARLNYEKTKIRKTAHFLEYAFFFPLGAAMFSLLAFYIANAAYRSFRVRSLEAMIMMIAALVVMLGQIPHGPLYISEELPRVRLWLLENLSTPAFRAIYFGAAIAGLAWAVRMWLSLETSPLAADQDE